jgi:hypothetical protein
MKSNQFKVVEEAEYGVYVWEMPDGKWVGDDDGNFLSVNAMRHDSVKLKMLLDSVRHYGVLVGKPVFLSGHRKIDDEEFETQKQRQAFGLIPDEYDIPALVSEQYYKEHNDK